MAQREPVMNERELEEFLDEVFPQQRGKFTIEKMASMEARLRMKITEAELRPGGTVSGPAMFTAVDCAFYVVVLGMIGRQALTVTTNCAINFMRKPEPKDLVVEAKLMKLGKTLAVGDATVFSPGVEGPVCHASLTYAIPPAR
ncbi:PaaI family thioesterase [Rhodovulum sp. DZ06]|uniref:PaaI family thioesterase n=1 Tax=Rhodovulum sp. DZ06 TaxID=3425126 RepID=UPI003D35740D